MRLIRSDVKAFCIGFVTGPVWVLGNILLGFTPNRPITYADLAVYALAGAIVALANRHSRHQVATP